jgi:hypothetical protein
MKNPLSATIITFLACLGCALAIASEARAQSPSGSQVRTYGNSHAGVTRTVSASGQLTSNRARGNALLSLVGSFLSRELTIASVTVSGDSNGPDQITMRVAGQTVYRSSTSSNPILHLTVWQGQITLLDLGVCTIRATANAGGGAQFGFTVTGTVSPPRLNINGAAQVYGNSEGSVGVQILFGLLGEASVSLTVNFLNSTIRAVLPVTSAGINSLEAYIDTILWQLKVKGKLKGPFGVTLASRTFVDISGVNQTNRIL